MKKEAHSKKNTIDLSSVRHVHFIGIGGIGMSALARYFLYEGKAVSGSDRTRSSITDSLQRDGVFFYDTQTSANIADEIDLVVYTEAMPQAHEELVASREQQIPCVNYFEALGLVANPYYLIAVSGTHGKTTTTAMAVDVLEAAGLDPTAVVGSLRSKTKSNFRAGKSKYCIVEACEYRRDFLYLKPSVLVITNIEAEHLDYYRDLADIQDAFGELARSVPEDGFIICNPSDPAVVPVLKGVEAQIIDYTKLIDPLLTLRTPGVHTFLNAGAVLGIAEALRIDPKVARQALEDFAGAWRRSEYIGETEKGAVIYDDYGHHPTEIETTLKGFRERYPKKRLVVAFQPHLHSRTEDFFDQFVQALAIADEVVLAPIFEARKETSHTVSSETLRDAIMESTGKKTHVFPDYEAVAEYLQANTGPDDLIITMGAGAINTVAEIITHKV